MPKKLPESRKTEQKPPRSGQTRKLRRNGKSKKKTNPKKSLCQKKSHQIRLQETLKKPRKSSMSNMLNMSYKRTISI